MILLCMHIHYIILIKCIIVIDVDIVYKCISFINKNPIIIKFNAEQYFFSVVNPNTSSTRVIILKIFKKLQQIK